MAAATAGDVRFINPFPEALLPRGYSTVEVPFVTPEVSLQYLILDFGGRRGKVDQARAEQLAAGAQFVRENQLVAFNVAESFYQLVTAEEGLEAARQTLKTAQVIGGIVLGLGSIVFLYPHMESIASLVLLIAAVSFVGAWLGGGRRFGFLGPQTAYAFFLVALVGHRPTTALLPAKDNLAGFAFAAVVMWVVFDQIASTSSAVLMRRLLATSLRITAGLLRLIDTPGDRGDKLVRGRILRYRMGKVTDQTRTENETVEYEFGPNHVAAIDQANHILNISFDTNSLFWEELAILYGDSDQEEQTNPEMVRVRRKISESLLPLADQLDDRKSSVGGQLKTGSLSEERDHTSDSPYARRAITQYRKIERAVQNLLAQTPPAATSPAPMPIREPLH